MKKFRKCVMCTVLAVATVFGSVFTASAADKPSTEPTAIIYKDNSSYKNEWVKYEESPVNGGRYSGWSYKCYHEHISSTTGNKYGSVYGDLKSTWAKIGGKWYYFSDHGYYSPMVIGSIRTVRGPTSIVHPGNMIRRDGGTATLPVGMRKDGSGSIISGIISIARVMP